MKIIARQKVNFTVFVANSWAGSKLAFWNLTVFCQTGTFDLYRCSGIPMYGSLPHFYKAEHLLSGVASGLHPNKSMHNCGAFLEVVSLALMLSTRDHSKINTQHCFCSTADWHTSQCSKAIAIQFGGQTHSPNWNDERFPRSDFTIFLGWRRRCAG